MGRQTCSILFLFIFLLQFSALCLSLLGHFPKLVTFGWKNFFIVAEDGSQSLLNDKRRNYMYGVWHQCEKNEIDTCEMIKDDDMIIKDDKYNYNFLLVARATLIGANVLAFFTVITSLVNSCRQNRVSTAFHLLFAFWQMCCFAVSVALVSTIYLDVTDNFEIGWVLICEWVSLGLMFLVMFFSILATCCEVTYGDYDEDNNNDVTNERYEKYQLEQVY